MSKTFHYDDTLGFVCRTLRYGNAPTIQIKKIPSADVVERKHGKWDKDSDMAFYWKCSECGAYLFWRHEDFMVNGNPNFCPNCGADMREGEDGEIS